MIILVTYTCGHIPNGSVRDTKKLNKNQPMLIKFLFQDKQVISTYSR